MDLIIIGVAIALMTAHGSIILARWGSGYTRRMGDEYWKQLNRSDIPEDEHYR